MRNARIFMGTAVAAIIVIIGSYFVLFRYQFRAPLTDRYELAYWVMWKEHLAKQPGNKRILIVGDSSSLFGMNSLLMEKALGRPVINLALHGSLPLNWLTKFAIRYARPGDTVIMPLAWPYYVRDYRAPEKWMLDQIVAWNHRFFDELSFIQKARYMAALDPRDFWYNLSLAEKRESLLHDNPAFKMLNSKQVIQNIIQAHQEKKIDKTNPYSYLNLGPRGDMLGACGNVGEAVQSYNGDLSPNSQAIALLSYTARELKKKGIMLILMPTVIVADANSESPAYRRNIDQLFALLKASGIKTAGKPKDFYFPPTSFFNTKFHLNCENAEERTRRMIAALKNSRIFQEV